MRMQPSMRGAELCFGFGLLLPMLHAQTTLPPQQGLVMRAHTRLVQIAVVVRDKKGQPVTDLRESDFTVEDEGKKQEIRFFSLESRPGVTKGAEPLPPGLFSNRRVAHSGAPGGVTVILLDGLNTRWGDQALAQKAVVEYLSQIQPHDRIALYTLGKQLKILHDFTESPAELVKSLAAWRGEHTPDLQGSSGGIIGGIAGLFQEEQNDYMVNRVETTLASLAAISKYLAGVPGRKNLLWVTGGFPLTVYGLTGDPAESLGGDPKYSARIGTEPKYAASDPTLEVLRKVGRNPSGGGRYTNFAEEFQNMIRALNTVDVSVYPVDARGLTTNPKAFSNIAMMKEIASSTGGRAYYDRNDVMSSIRDAVQDSVVSYNLAYYPTEKQPDGRFRKIKVKVNRAGLTVRHRPGYYDLSNSPSDQTAKDVAVRSALWSPLDATAVALDAELNPAVGSNPEALPLRLRIDPANLTLEQRDGRWVGQFDVALMQTDDKGGEFGLVLQTVPLALAQDAYDVVTKTGLVLNKIVQRNPAATALRIVVRDAASGSFGRIVIPLQKR